MWIHRWPPHRMTIIIVLCFWHVADADATWFLSHFEFYVDDESVLPVDTIVMPSGGDYVP